MSEQPRNIRSSVKAQLDSAFPTKGSLPSRGAPETNRRRVHFGLAMMLIGLIPIVGGAYPIAIDLSGRLVLMAIGIACVWIGARQIHLANCELKVPGPR